MNIFLRLRCHSIFPIKLRPHFYLILYFQTSIFLYHINKQTPNNRVKPNPIQIPLFFFILYSVNLFYHYSGVKPKQGYNPNAVDPKHIIIDYPAKIIKIININSPFLVILSNILYSSNSFRQFKKLKSQSITKTLKIIENYYFFVIDI